MKAESVKFGYASEQKVAEHLEKHGYIILKRRFKTTYGEIDIIARNAITLLLVEVKARRNQNFQDCISRTQAARSIAAAHMFLDAHPEYTSLEMRYDLVMVGKNGEILEIVENAIMDEF